MKGEDLIDLLLKVCFEQGLCNLPESKVMIFHGENEHDDLKEKYSFKITGGEEVQDEEQE